MLLYAHVALSLHAIWSSDKACVWLYLLSTQVELKHVWKNGLVDPDETQLAWLQHDIQDGNALQQCTAHCCIHSYAVIVQDVCCHQQSSQSGYGRRSKARSCEALPPQQWQEQASGVAAAAASRQGKASLLAGNISAQLCPCCLQNATFGPASCADATACHVQCALNTFL